MGTSRKIKFYFILIFSFIHSPLFAGWVHQTGPTSVNLNGVNFHHGSEDLAWACGDNGTIIHTSNGGINWVIQNSGTTNDLYAIIFMEGSGSVMSVGQNGTILRTSNNGQNWTLIPSTTTRDLHDITEFNFLIAGDSGIILKSINTGLSWTPISSPTTKNLYTICATFGGYAAGEDGTILRGVSSGANWTLAASGVTNNLKGTPLFGGIDIVVGDNGLILRSTNSGTNWYTQNSHTANNLNSVEYSVNNTSRLYCVGDSGTILKTTDYGITWGFQQSGTTKDLNSTFFYLNDNTGYAVGDNGTILKTTDGGGAITNTDPLTNIPDKFHLYQNYPNPFNPSTNIKFDLPNNVEVNLSVYDIEGKKILTLVNNRFQGGTYEYTLDASGLPSGVYFYTLKAGNILLSKKMLLVK